MGKAEAFGAIHSVGFAMPLGVCTQTPESQKPHLLWNGPEHLDSLVSQYDEKYTGVLEMTAFLVRKYLLSRAPLHPHTTWINRRHSALLAASQLAIRGLVLLCSWVAFICVNKAPASVWPVNKETGLPGAWRPSPKLVHLAQGHPNLCVWWGQVREERISKALLSTCPQKINAPKLQQKSESLGECC